MADTLLRKLRRSAGLSQEELAARAGITRWRLHRAEGGEALRADEVERVRAALLAAALQSAETVYASLAEAEALHQ